MSSIPAVSDIYPMFIEPSITLVPSGFFGYIWLDTKNVLKKGEITLFKNGFHSHPNAPKSVGGWGSAPDPPKARESAFGASQSDTPS